MAVIPSIKQVEKACAFLVLMMDFDLRLIIIHSDFSGTGISFEKEFTDCFGVLGFACI